jgi:hypothetical protein
MYVPLEILDIIFRKRKMMMLITKLENTLKLEPMQLILYDFQNYEKKINNKTYFRYNKYYNLRSVKENPRINIFDVFYY